MMLLNCCTQYASKIWKAQQWPTGLEKVSFHFSPKEEQCQRMLKPPFPGDSDSKEICLQCRRPGLNPWVRKIPWRREWLPRPVFFPGEFHGQQGLVGYSPWGYKELDMTEWLTLHFTAFYPYVSILHYVCFELKNHGYDGYGVGGNRQLRGRQVEGTGTIHYFWPFPRQQANPLLNQRPGI